MLSRFLPQNFDPNLPIAVIAGRGHYPERTIEQIRAHGLAVRLIGFEEETRDSLVESFSKSERVMIKVGQVGKLLKALKAFDAGYSLMAGQIRPRRLFKGLHPDIKAIRILASLKEKNAETIFGALTHEIESIGVTPLDARAFLDDDIVAPGILVKGKEKVDPSYIEHGIRMAKGIAALDIGQGVVVRKGTAIAIEAFEGTDPMLQRAGTFKADKMIFVKTSKPKQNFCFDVPVFGLRTIEVMAASNIKTAALEAHTTILLHQQEVLDAAKRAGITVIGYEV